MGTSNAYGGPNGKTPLIPSWLSGDAPPALENTKPNELQPLPPVPIPPPGDTGRFRNARGNFTRFVVSGGRDRANLGRAISNYVSRSSGGAKQAVRRMGASRTAAKKLAYFLSAVSSQGIRQVLKVLNLESLAGRPIDEIFLGLVEYICPDGGSIDEGIAREAFIETIADLSQSGITSLDNMTPEQIQTVFELYATHSIEIRLCNDIGNKTIILPVDPHEVASIQAQLRDFIRRGVADAINQARISFKALTSEQVHNYVDQVYETAFSILQAIGEKEGDVA